MIEAAYSHLFSRSPSEDLMGLVGGSWAAQMMFVTAPASPTPGDERGLRDLRCTSFTKGEGLDKRRLLLVEAATLAAAAEGTEGLFFTICIVC